MNRHIVLLIAFLLNVAHAAFTIPEPLSDGVKGNPGTQICIRRNFLPAISDVFGKILEAEIPKIIPPDTTIKLAVNNQGSVTVQNMRFVAFSGANDHSLSLVPPNQTEWISTGLNYNITGHFRSTLQQLFSNTQTSGSIFLDAKNATVIVRTRIHAARDGQQRLEMVSCKATFTNTSVNTQASGFFGALSKFFQKVISASSSILLERITCNLARQYVESVVNVVYANSISTNVSVSESGRGRSILPPELIYNYGLLRDPRVYKNCLSMQQVGEVSWENKRWTPFHPPRLNYSTKRVNDHMLDVWVSDYVFNSLLFHANDHRILDTILDERQTPQWAPNLQSQCANSPNATAAFAIDCVGNALPELANTNDFPRQTVEMHLKPSNSSTAPYVIFRDDLPALLVADLVLDLFANDSKRQRKNILTADVHSESHIRNMKLSAAPALSAEIIKTNATLQIKQDQLFLLPRVKEARASSLGVFAASLIEKILNSQLSVGLPLPSFKGVKLLKPESVLLNRTMNIAADVELDQAFWSKTTAEARLRVQNKKS